MHSSLAASHTRRAALAFSLIGTVALLASTASAVPYKYPPGPPYRPFCASLPDSINLFSIQQSDTSLAPCHPATLDTVLGVRGIVTGFDAKASAYGFYMQQSAGGAFSGVDVFTGATNYNAPVPGTPTGGNLALGDEVVVYGTTQEFQSVGGETEIEGPDQVQATNDIIIRRIGTGHALPPWKIATTSEINWVPALSQGEQWEGCLVRVRGPLKVGRVIGATIPTGMFLVTTVAPSSDSVLVDGTTLTTFAAPSVGTVVDSAQGIVNQRVTGVSSYRLQLRDASDIIVAAPPTLTDAYSIESNQVRLVFDRDLDPATAQQAVHYSLSSAGAGSTVNGAVMPATPGRIVVLTISNPSVPVGGFEGVSVSGVGAASCPSCVISPSQLRSFYNGVLTCAQVQAPDPALLPSYDDRSRYAGSGALPGARLTFRGIAVHTYGTLAYLMDETPSSRGGVSVFGPTQPLLDGHRYRVSAQVQEFGGETEVVATVDVTDEGVGTTPAALYTPIAALRDTATDMTQTHSTGEDYEGMLVAVTNAKVTVSGGVGQSFTIAGPAPGYPDTIVVSNLNGALNGYTPPAALSIVNVAGVLHFTSGTFRICPRSAADVQAIHLPSLTFSQLSFASDSGNASYSSLGMCGITYVASQAEAYLNVAVRLPGSGNGGWALRNVYLPDSVHAIPIENFGCQFPLYPIGVTDGTPVPQLEYSVLVTPAPLLDADSLAWTLGRLWQGPVSVAQLLRRLGDGTAREVTFTLALDSVGAFPAYNSVNTTYLSSWLSCRVPNVDLDDTAHPGELNACGPAAAANSLKWLDDQHPEITIPSDLRSVLGQLSVLMNRLFRQGVGGAEFIRAKLDFIEAHKLPIHVKFQSRLIAGDILSTTTQSHASNQSGGGDSPVTNAWMQSESNHDEDVELLGIFVYVDPVTGDLKPAGGHAVVLSGAGTKGGAPFVIIKDDSIQARATGTRELTSTVDSTKKYVIIRGLGGRITLGPSGPTVDVFFIVDTVISESYDPTVQPPATVGIFDDYCNWTCRIVPPGGKLKLKFPQGSRSYCVTLYEEERTVKPPVIHKVLTWNLNSDSTRIYVNFDTTECAIVWIHNDDNQRNGATYTPWALGMDVLPANVAASSSADNSNWFGGFSAGGADGKSVEFGDPTGPNVTVNASVGCNLSSIPSHLGEGVQQLTLTHPIAVPNQYWSQLELRLAVASVPHAGTLNITCPSTGYSGSIAIAAAGTYVVPLGSWVPLTNFSLTLAAQGALDFEIDAIGVPSLVTVPVGVDEPRLPMLAGLWMLSPNPSRGSFTLRFDLPAPGNVQLAVHDAAGRRIAVLASGPTEAGSHRAVWDGRDGSGARVSAGVYFCRLKIDDRSWVARCVVVR